MPKKLFIALLIIVTGCNDRPLSEEDKLKEIIAQYPDSLLLKENLIQYYRDNGNYSNAIAETEKSLKKDSTNDRLWDIAATLYFENEDTLKAIYAFEKAIEIKADPQYIIALGSLYAETGNPYALAMADALLQAPLAQAESQAFFIKGLYYSNTGDKIKAIDYFNRCLVLNYGDMFAYREKAICLYDLQKYNEALDVLQTAVSVQSSFDEGYYWMGKCYEKLNKRKEAIESYQTALSLSPDFIEAKDALSKMGVAY